MSIELIEINGQCKFFDYIKFKKTCKETIGKTCSDAKIFAFNNFPVAVSSETNIDLILVLALNPKKGNYYRIWKNKKWVYLNNLILPINFVNYLQDENIKVEDNQIICNEEYVDYSTEIMSLKFSFIDYFSLKCGLNKRELFIEPIIIIKNGTCAILDNYIISEEFTFNALNEYLLKNSFNIFISYKNWKTGLGYENISDDIKKITEQASNDSEIGYLTKKKIDRIGKQLSSAKKIYEELDQNLIIINGKAGTGKSSELLTLTLKCISNGQNTLFLTYNNLLIFDVAKTVRSFINAKLNLNQEGKQHGGSSVTTLHSFFYNLSKSLGVLHVLSADRIEELLSVLKTRMRANFDYLIQQIDFTKTNNFEIIKAEIQNNSEFDNGIKGVGVDFINYIANKPLLDLNQLKKYSKDFFQTKKKLLEGIETKKVFLADYYGVLENTLLQIENTDSYFEKYNIENKHELLDVAIKIKDRYTEVKDGKTLIRKDRFKETVNRRVGGHRRKRTVFIDEAQDCHRLEKEILTSIFGSKKIVIANGGKEQLIRHVELCNWEILKGNKIETTKHYKRNKSYRVKKTVGEFCNYVANHFKIDLNLEPIESEDEGELLVDFRTKHTDHEIQDIFKQLNLKGEVNGCSAYEGLLILIESNTQKGGANRNEVNETVINEYGNIESSQYLNREKWKYLKPLKNDNLMFWDGTVSNKSYLPVPYSYESRLIYYESCRGLESWSVACFSIDKFFKLKKEEPKAEKFLLTEEKEGRMNLFLTNEERRSMYAATWTLMALTRVIDTLYIQIDDESSEFGKVVRQYLEVTKTNVKEL